MQMIAKTDVHIMVSFVNTHRIASLTNSCALLHCALHIRMSKLIKEQLKSHHKYVPTDPVVIKQIDIDAECMKRQLSTKISATTKVANYEVKIFAVTFNTKVMEWVNKTTTKIREVIDRVKTVAHKSQISAMKVISVGGSSRVPAIGQQLQKVFQYELMNNPNDPCAMDPDTIVGIGAGIIAGASQYGEAAIVCDNVSTQVGMEIEDQATHVNL